MNFFNDYQSPNNFVFTINHLEDANLTIQRISVPSVNIGKIEVFNDSEGDVPVPSNRVNFETANVTIIVDEGMKNYKEIFDWMYLLASCEDSHNEHTSDAMLIINSNANVPMTKIQYHSMFPINIGEVEFDTMSDGNDVMVFSVVFAFDKFEFVD